MRNGSCPQFKKQAKDRVTGTTSDKIILTSKSRSDVKAESRKPVKECYCITENAEKIERSSGVEKNKYLFENCCRNDTELVEIYPPLKANKAVNSLLVNLLGNETIKRAGRITYLPTSEFLRRVQKRVSCHRRKKQATRPLEFSSSPSTGDSRLHFSEHCGKNESITRVSQSEGRSVRRGEKALSTNNWDAQPEMRGGKKIMVPLKSSRSRSLCLETQRTTGSRESENIQRVNESKTKPRVGSKKFTRSVDRVAQEKPKSHRIVRTISARSRCRCSQNAVDTTRKTCSNGNLKKQPQILDKTIGNCDCEIHGYSGTNRSNLWQLSREHICSKIGDNEDRVRELSKFRRANYFETHGSIDTLVGNSRRSMTTLEQCEFNDRLSTPRCSAKQTRRIHYYPSYVVREERSDNDSNCRKRIRARSCDLVGHVVDLGILKIPCDFSNNRIVNRYRGGDCYE